MIEDLGFKIEVDYQQTAEKAPQPRFILRANGKPPQ
jgi:hypothetical protein